MSLGDDPHRFEVTPLNPHSFMTIGQRLWKGIKASVFPLLLVLYFLLVRYMLGYAPSGYVVRDALSGMAIALIVLKLFRTTGLRLYLGLWLLLALGYGAVGLTYGVADKNAVVALLSTNPSEAKEFLLLMPTQVYVLYGVVLVFYALLFWMSGTRERGLMDRAGRIGWLDGYRRGGWTLAAVVLLVSITGASVIRAAMKDTIGWHMVRVNEVVLVRDVGRAVMGIRDEDRERSIFARTPHWQVEPLATLTLPACDTCVVVMGESVREDFLGAFGAPWKNTPWMSAQPGLKLTHFLSASFATVPSLSVELYAPHPEGRAPFADNVMTLAKAGGYHTAWLSNQDKRGGDDSPVSMVASFADYVYFTEDNPTGGRADEALLTPLKDYLAQGKPGEKRFIFLHLYGSHPVACNRTGGKYTEWFMSEELSCYIETIRRTDALLKAVADLVRENATANHGRWGLLYTADHGLRFMETSEGWALKHRGDFQDVFRVPFFMTGSGWEDAVNAKSAKGAKGAAGKTTPGETITVPRSGRYFSLMVADWLGLKATGPFEAPVCAWFKEETCSGQTTVRRAYEPFVDIQTFEAYSLSDFMREHPAKKARDN